MRLKLHYIQKNKNKKFGMVILESAPQMRTLFTYGNKGRACLPFPYLIHIICYSMQNGKFIYGGVEKSGLRVFLRNSPLNTIDDVVFISPTDAENYGLVCTPHDFDHSEYDTLPELINKVITIWWNATHYIKNVNSWLDLSLEQAVKNNWGDFTISEWDDDDLFAPLPLLDALKRTEKSGYGRNNFYPENSVLVDKIWTSK